MHITIKAMGGQSVTLEVQDSDTVGSVKAQLVASQGIPVEKQRLLFADTELEDDESTLKTCGVSHGAVISLILRKSEENMKKLTEAEKKELKVAQSSQVSQYYNATVGLNDELKTAKLDKHNNPIGGEFDLGKDGEFGEFVVILGIFYTMSGDGEKIKKYMTDALERKGFFTIVHFNQTQFVEEINKADIAIIISSNSMGGNDKFVKGVADFHSAGGALYIFGDNDPWYAHANALLPVVLKDPTVKLVGNTPGYKVLKLGEATKTGCFGPHIITTGIINLFEGVTICYPSPLGPLKVLATSTDGHPTVCYADNEALKNNTCGRIMVDCAFTKLYINWDDAGTARYIINSCIWLLGIEHKVLMGMTIQGKGVLNVAKDGDRVRNPKYQKGKESNNNNDNSDNKKSLLGSITSTLTSLVPSFANLTTNSTTSSIAPIDFTAKAELVVLENEAGEGSSTAVQPEYASLNVTLSSNIDVESAEKSRWLILVADQSGSMQGNPWYQVKGALEYMLETSYKSKNIRSDVIMYNGGALILTKHCTPENFVSHINATSAFGQTNFRAAYDAISNLIDSRAGQITPDTDVSIVFMTDGAHTSRDNCEEALEELRDIIQALPCSVVVHAVGFSLDHNYSMLREITTIGKEQGAYQYAEPSDGPDALKTKLESIFDYATIAGEKVKLTMNLEGYNFVSGIDSELHTETKQISSRTDTEGDLVVGCTVLPVAPGTENLKLNILVDAQKQSQTLTVDITKRLSAEVLFIKVKRMDQQLEAIVVQISSHNSPPTDTEREKYLAALQRIQHSLREYEGPNLFRLNKESRETVVSLVQTMRSKLAQLFETIAAWARGQWTTQNRARLADIAYSNMFAKGNRQRRMDARVAKNAERQKEEFNNLKNLKIDEEKLQNVSQDSVELFNCVLRLSNWKELTMEKDACGFGLAVGRPEFVVDDSTQLRVFQISNTFCSKSAIEDSIKYSIDVQGQVATTGGFGIGNEVGVATRGMSREPINAWLPLYIHQQHWDIIKIQLRSILGYFVALDPLGFSMDQVDSLFLVLGTMISRCAHSETHSPGERELLLLFQYMRTCEAVAREMKWFPKIEERLKITIERLHYDSSDQVKNLLVVVGYLAILPEDTIKRVFPEKSNFAELWVAILAISARRSGFTIFKNLQEPHVRLFLDQVLYGEPTGYDDSSNNAADILGVQKYENLMDEHTLADDDSDTITQSILQYGKAMDKFGYPTISSLYTCLSFYLAWREWSNEMTKDPSVSILAQLDDTYGVANEKWISFIKEKFASYYTSSTPSIIGFLETVDKNFGLPHSVTSIARAVVAQAFEAKTYMNTIEDPKKCLTVVHNNISSQRKTLGGSLLAAQRLANLVNTTIVRTDISNFVENLHAVLPNQSRRDNSFKALLIELTAPGAITTIPFAVWKLRVIINGKYPQKVGDEVVESIALDGGGLWIPGRRYTIKFARAFGSEIFLAIQQALASNPKKWCC